MILSANTWCFKEMDRETVFKTMARLGLKGVEIITHGPCYHADTLDTAEMRERTLELLNRLGLEIVALSPHTEFLIFDREARRQAVEHCMAQIDLTELYGAKIARIFSGGRIPEGKTKGECIDAVVEALKPCTEYAEKRGIKLAVESHGKFGNDLEAMVTILDEINSPMLGVTLDTANFKSNGVDPVEAIDVLKDRIFHTHLKDILFTENGRQGAAVGEGSLDFRAILKKLKEVGYKGKYCIEYEGKEPPETGLSKSIAYLNRLGDELGL